jgi:hypothetical protein
VCVANATTTEERQPVVTVMKEEMDQILEAAQEKGKEHSEEWLKIFSQEAEKETVAALKLKAKEENGDKILTPWELELEMLEDWLSHPEPVDDFHEKTIM